MPPPARVEESAGSINKKLLASAGVICFLTHILTVQGLLLTAFLAASAAVPVAAVAYAIRKRDVVPALMVLGPLFASRHVALLNSIYCYVVNPVSVQVKARITMPALVHAWILGRHPILHALLTMAQVLSQITIVVLLLQYALAPKMAEAMRQRAIMLCRAFTSTEAQGMRSKDGRSSLEVFPNKQVLPAKGDASRSLLGDLHIWRGEPQQMKPQDSQDSMGADMQRIERLREAIFSAQAQTEAKLTEQDLAVGEGQPLYNEFADGAPAAEEMATGGKAQLWTQDVANDAQQGTFDPLHIKLETEDGIAAAATKMPLDLPSLVEDISSPQQLFAVLDEQLSVVQSLIQEAQARKISLRDSEMERASLAQELEATAGEKASLSEELSALGLRFAAAQSLWESQLESERENSQALARAAQADRQQVANLEVKLASLDAKWDRQAQPAAAKPEADIRSMDETGAMCKEASTLVPRFHVAVRGNNQETEAADLTTGCVKL